jgi:hypothetical protein
VAKKTPDLVKRGAFYGAEYANFNANSALIQRLEPHTPREKQLRINYVLMDFESVQPESLAMCNDNLCLLNSRQCQDN